MFDDSDPVEQVPFPDKPALNSSPVLSVPVKMIYEEAASLKELGIGPDQVPDRQGLSGAGETGDLSGKIDLNSASVEQLMTLPGIGESKAEAIIRYREESGPFSCTEDVMNISGIKDRVYSQIEDCITVQ